MYLQFEDTTNNQFPDLTIIPVQANASFYAGFR